MAKSANRLQNLPSVLLFRIALELMQDLPSPPLYTGTLSLLPLRLIHPSFTPAVTHAIFRECHIGVKPADFVKSSEKLMAVPTFLRYMRHPRLQSQIQTVHIGLADRDRGDSYVVKIIMATETQECFQVLRPIAGFVRVLEISEFASLWVWSTYSTPETLRDSTPVTFARLRALALDTSQLRLLVPLVEQAPGLEAVKIQGNPHWTEFCNILDPNFLDVNDQHTRAARSLRLYILDNASDPRQQTILAQFKAKPRCLRLRVSARQLEGVEDLMEGANVWTIFSHTEHVFFEFEDPGREGFEAVKHAIAEGGGEIEWYEYSARKYTICLKGYRGRLSSRV